MRFQLPQFIETEIKLVGPFTLKQFLWVAAGGTLLFVDFSIIHGVIAIVIALPIIAASAAMAFLKIDGMPLVNYMANALSFMLGPKKYIFRKEAQQSQYYNPQKPNAQ
ncbi:MAG TPA: PrgI family protein [Candidatus Paceibacterota bacterium]|nr:PrgI family protein [Candidatus Paceibacterota bacterium]